MTGLPTSEMFLGAVDNPFEAPFSFRDSYSYKTIITFKVVTCNLSISNTIAKYILLTRTQSVRYINYNTNSNSKTVFVYEIKFL